MQPRYLAELRRQSAWSIIAGLAIGGVAGIALVDALFALAVVVLQALGHFATSLSSTIPWSDPVYTRAAVHSLADISVSGIGVGQSEAGGFAGSVLTPGSSLLGRSVANSVAQTGVLIAGLLVLARGAHARRMEVIAAGIGLQLEVAIGFVLAPLTPRDLETMGLSFAINASIPTVAGRRFVVSDLLEGLQPPLTSGLLVGLSMICIYVFAVTAIASGVAASGWLCWYRRSQASVGRFPKRVLLASVLTTMAVVAASTLLSACGVRPAASAELASAGRLAEAPSALSPTRSDAFDDHVSVSLTSRSEPGSLPLTSSDRWYLDSAPSHVEVVSNSGTFRYAVNGKPEIIHGMGLNTQYHAQLTTSDRRARLDADFTEMQALGINTLVGWDPAEFDDTLLQLAQRHEIGVVMPFELDPRADYTDPTIRDSLKQQVLRWVDTYRNYPAVRMWGLGNEVLHKIVHPAWVGPQDPGQAANARAFAAWLVETADAIHTADPDHPVTYRDAEDAFVGWVGHALARVPADRSAWFIWGTNCYQDYLGRIIDEWPSHQMGVALWVSEFAPGGLAIPDRPAGFTQMWGLVGRQPGWVLGGAVYAWTRNGPEEIDRNLGLTDDGTPVDGRSLAAIAAMFHSADWTAE